MNLALAIAELGKTLEAIELCQCAIKIKEDARAYGFLGQSLASLDRWPEVEAAYRRGLELDPNHSGILANLGVAVANLGRFAEATELFEKSLRVDPANVTVQHNLAQLREIKERE